MPEFLTVSSKILTIADQKEQKNITATISLKLSNIALWIENTGADSIKLYNLIP